MKKIQRYDLVGEYDQCITEVEKGEYVLYEDIKDLIEQGECRWWEDSNGECWISDCGSEFCLTDGTPEDNEMVYCSRCGKKIKVLNLTCPDCKGVGWHDDDTDCAKCDGSGTLTPPIKED